ncbi:acyl-CoA synthetase family member 2 [Homo sapiens]|uniref:Acyl-CoA synthetase family member 2 n=2 Tax=Hominidae TaxID=9604 RepID=D6RF15_HUMAN|nr:acyl-CoA synthetase family member 2 [Homo sapiens]KAI4050454.1 acyl-CoA synthetase family member 2 [Homo sapiens]PNJ66130.1 ACSF2 isoform 24 [Pongo abelii]
MAVYVGMLRLGRLCAGSSGVLGARAALSRSWQEARLQGVRFLRPSGEKLAHQGV